MRSVVRGTLLGMVLVVSAPMAHAQGVASTLRELQLLVRPGETVTVTDAQGREVQGRIETLSPSLLALSDRSGRHEWTEADIVSIRQRKGDSLANGALWGLAVGAGVGAITGEWAWAAGGAAIGAASGYLYDQQKKKEEEAYRRGIEAAKQAPPR